jgi:nucleoside-diphosphate-sugar epimerase
MKNILITGSTGYIGNLITGKLLTETDSILYLVVRPQHQLEKIIQNISAELTAQKITHDPNALKSRLILVPLNEANDFSTLPQEFIKLNLPVTEIIHAAGCIEYFNKPLLEKINVEYTRYLLEYAQQINIQRFIYISTAYSAGFTDNVIEENLLPEQSNDPTDYTRTKRAAERLVATAHVPFIIMRPSIVIGDSRNGHYSGKRYGLYQQWLAQEKLFCDEYQPVIHLLASDYPLNFLHQDAFLNTFWAAYQQLPNNQWINIVSHADKAPTPRQLMEIWMQAVSKPQKIIYYERFEDIPLAEIPANQRIYLNFSKTNAEIAGHNWKFSTKNLDKLIAQNLNFTDASIATVQICQQKFIEESAKIQNFLREINVISQKFT